MNLSDGQKSSLLLTVFLGVVGLIVVGYFHFMFGRGMVSSYERRRQDTEQKVEVLEQDLAQVRELVGQRAEIEAQAKVIEQVTRRLPSSPDAPGFLNALLTTLSTTGIIQEEVKPAGASERALYTEIPYTVNAHGRYHSIGQFLTLIEQNPERFMRVRNMTIKNNVKRPSVHPIEMDITTFKFNQ